LITGELPNIEASAAFRDTLKLYLLVKEMIIYSKQLSPEIEVNERGRTYADYLQSTVIPWFDDALQLWITELKQSLMLHVPHVVDHFFKQPMTNGSQMQTLILEVCIAMIKYDNEVHEYLISFISFLLHLLL
jgi:translation initiation factor 2 beta subunit (eIF-2beta)/eIF-5